MSPVPRRKALIVSYYFPPMADVAALRAYYFARYLPDYGYDPVVVTATSPTDLNIHLLDDLAPTCTVLRVDKWYRWPFDLSLGALFASLRARQIHDFDIVLGTGPTWGSLKTALFVARLTRRPFIADIRDPWTHGYMWHPSGRIDAAIQRRWERAVLRGARRTIYVDPMETQRMRSSMPTEVAAKIVTITHGHDDMVVDAKRSDSEDKCTFCHLGKFHPQFRSPALLFKAFRLACRDYQFAQDARLHLYGDPAGFETSREVSGLEQQIVFRGVVSQMEAARCMRGADALVFLQVVRIEESTAPTLKIYDYLASRRPILGIAPKGGTTAELIEATGNSVVVGIEDPQVIANGMLSIWRGWRSGTLRPHDMDISRFSRPQLTRQLAGLFDEVLGEGQQDARP